MNNAHDWREVEKRLQEEGATDGILYCYRYVVYEERGHHQKPKLYIFNDPLEASEAARSPGQCVLQIPENIVARIEKNCGPYIASAKELYAELQKQALPTVKAYQRDLTVHDFNTILVSAIDNGRLPRFLHVAYSMGTDIEILKRPEEYPPKGVEVKHLFSMADRIQLLEQVGSSIEYRSKNNPESEVRYCNGKEIRQVSFAEAQTVVNKYKEAIRSEWNLEQKKHQTYTAVGIEL